MKNRIALVAAIMGLAGGFAQVHADDVVGSPECLTAPGNPVWNPEQVLVRFQPGTTRAQVDASIAAVGGVGVVMTYDLVPDLYCVQVPAGSPEKIITDLSRDAGVKYAELDYYRFALAQSTPYGIDMVMAPQAWPTSRGGTIRVAVLDTGLDLSHPDLPTPVLMRSFINGQAVDDLHSHGTHTAGTVLAIDNTIGVVGVAPEASLMVGKVLGNAGYGSDAGVLAGIDWAVTNGARVVSMSLGGGGASQAGQDTITAAVNANVLVLASAGNANSSDPSYPASYTGVMSIAAVDSDGVKASFSNFGPLISVTAPGVNVQSSVPIISGNATWSGTTHSGTVLGGSGFGSVSGQAIFCGYGATAADFPPSVAGNIAHIRRGSGDGSAITFLTKAQNAEDAGAIGVIISNNTGGTIAGTLNATADFPVVGITQADGNSLEAVSGVQTTLFVGQTGHGYANFSGTSMSCPHVAGVAALVMGAAGGTQVPITLVREAIENTATDLGDPGRDDIFGHGLVNADAAKTYLLAHLCGSADFDGDGDTGTDADIEAFFACLAGNCCATCATADFDADGDTGTDADIEAFFRVLAGGNC